MPDIDPRSTVAQLKDDIDSGRTGDKIAGFDPAAAPLGTDDEAGGTPPTPETVAHARAAERSSGSPSAQRNAAQPELQPDARGVPMPILKPLLIGVGAAALLAVGMIVLL